MPRTRSSFLSAPTRHRRLCRIGDGPRWHHRPRPASTRAAGPRGHAAGFGASTFRYAARPGGDARSPTSRVVAWRLPYRVWSRSAWRITAYRPMRCGWTGGGGGDALGVADVIAVMSSRPGRLCGPGAGRRRPHPAQYVFIRPGTTEETGAVECCAGGSWRGDGAHYVLLDYDCPVRHGRRPRRHTRA